MTCTTLFNGNNSILTHIFGDNMGNRLKMLFNESEINEIIQSVYRYSLVLTNTDFDNCECDNTSDTSDYDTVSESDDEEISTSDTTDDDKDYENEYCGYSTCK